ncbi:hypothetical protein D3C86_2100880 [compost metagenome]
MLLVLRFSKGTDQRLEFLARQEQVDHACFPMHQAGRDRDAELKHPRVLGIAQVSDGLEGT